MFQCDIYAELGEVINGHKEAFREKTTIFKSVGERNYELMPWTTPACIRTNKQLFEDLPS